jgi:hypothetical protein
LSPRAGLDGVEKRKILPLPGLLLLSSSSSTYASKTKLRADAQTIGYLKSKTHLSIPDTIFDTKDVT